MTQQPVVSVCIICYNQEAFIKQTIESILMQKTSFDIQLIISNDCSTDATSEIIQSVIKSHAKGHVITYYNHKSNLGMMPNFIFALKKCQGKYIAICEGDDYWTDPLKLEKQVAFLENNPDYGICFHNVEQLNSLHKESRTIIPGVLTDTDFSLYDYIQANRTATCSIVYRRELFETIPDWFTTVPFGDLGLVLNVLKNSKNKKGKVLRDTLGVYRMHDAGIHGSLHKNNKSLILAYKQHLEFIKIIEKRLLYEPTYQLAFNKSKVKIFAKLADLTKQERNLLQFLNYKLRWYFKLMYLSIKF